MGRLYRLISPVVNWNSSCSHISTKAKPRNGTRSSILTRRAVHRIEISISRAEGHNPLAKVEQFIEDRAVLLVLSITRIVEQTAAS